MTKAGEKILKGARQARAYARGEKVAGVVVHEPVDVAAIRKGSRLSQPEFAKRYNIPVGTLRDWEQGRVVPERMARMFLRIIEKNPGLAAVAAQEEAA